MIILLILAIGFYLYKTGELQNLFGNSLSNANGNSKDLKEVINYRYASGQISVEEYNKLKALL